MRLVPALLAASFTATLLPAAASAEEPVPVAPAAPAEAPPMGNVALFRGGAVLGGFGLAFVVIGGGLFASGPSDCLSFPCPGTGRRDTGTMMMLVGAPLVAFSLPMMYLGARPAEPETPAEKAVPAVSLGPRGGSLRWVF